MYSLQERELAHEIAAALNDRLSIGLHLKYAREVPHHVLRQALAKVMSVKDENVLVSRARIYTTIIQAYLEDHDDGAGD